LSNLKKLDVSGYCGISDKGISKLNLIELNAFCNNKITNVNHMTNLKILHASYNCGIDNKGISKLNLIELHVAGNEKITKKFEK